MQASPFVEGARVISGYAEQVIERRQLDAFMGDHEAQVFQVGIAIADEDVEHQPAKEPGPGHRWAATGIGQCCQP